MAGQLIAETHSPSPWREMEKVELITAIRTRIGRMTHLLARRDALSRKAEEYISKTNMKACSACGKDFWVARSWQKHCSPRCRQRTYVQRQSETPMGYYGA